MDVSRANGRPRLPSRVDERIQRLKRLLGGITEARDKTTLFRCQLSRILLRCEAFIQVALPQHRPEVVCNEVEPFLEKVRRNCRDWKGLDFVQTLVRVPTELTALENEAKELCVKLQCSPVREPSKKEIESDEEHDWTDLVDRYKDRFSDDFKTECEKLSETDATAMTKVLQKVFTTTTDVVRMSKEPSRNLIFRIINSLSKYLGKIISVPIIDIDVDDGEVFAVGGFASILKAQYNRQLVAVKCPRIFREQEDCSNGKMLRREVLLWHHISRLHHENILPLIGITSSQFPMKMVSPLCINGNLLDFVKKNITVNRLGLLVQVACGLKALHDHVPVVIHADLKCENVFVKADGTACLADFGLAAVRHNGATLTSFVEGGSLRWMAVELFDPGNGSQAENAQQPSSRLKVTRNSDIWSFGMLALELFTEKVPFPDMLLPTVVMLAVLDGRRPSRPTAETVGRGLNQQLWNRLCQCWDSSPEKRPSLDTLISVLERLSNDWYPCPAANVQQQSTVSIPVPKEIYGHIIGKNHRNIRALEATHDVLIDEDDQGIKIQGISENVEAASIQVQEIVEERSNKIEEVVEIPRRLHGWLIGHGGDRIGRFQACHHVRVTFGKNSDKVTVVGSPQQVEKAITELLQTVDLDSRWNPSREVMVSRQVAHRLQRGNLKQLTGLNSMRLLDDRNGNMKVKLTGSINALDTAMNAIRDHELQCSEETERRVTVPVDLRGLILGKGGSAWSEMVVRCGGPEDPHRQHLMLDIPRNPNDTQAILRGNSQVISALAKEIQRKVDENTKDVYGMHMPKKYQNMLRSQVRNVAQTTETEILYPDHDQYAFYVSPVNTEEMPKDDYFIVVKIVGTVDAYKQAREKLKRHIDELRQRTLQIQVPLKYEQAIYERVWRRLKDMNITVSPPVDSGTQVSPISPVPSEDSEFSWDIIKRYDDDIVGTSTWTIVAPSKEPCDEARSLIGEAYEEVRLQRHIGYLTFRDRSKFGAIIGSGGEICERTQRDTRTIIHVPKKDSPPEDTTVVIIGAKEGIKEAKNTIIRQVSMTGRTRSDDRLFRRPRALSLRTRTN